MDVAITNRHLLWPLDREAIEAGYLPDPLNMVLAFTCRSPTPASKHLDGICCQRTLACLIEIVEVQVLLLQPPELDTVLGHLSLDLVEEFGPCVAHCGGTDEYCLFVGGQRRAKCQCQLNVLDLGTTRN